MTAIATQAGTIRVLVVDDHTLVRQSLAKLIGNESGFRVVGDAGRLDEALARAAECQPDMVVLDVSMPGGTGLELGEKLRARMPGIRLLFLTMHDDEATVARAVAIGADGYVLKSAPLEELLTALRAVAAGGSFLSPSVARAVMRRASGHGDVGTLTDRELETLRLMAGGARPTEVARQLYVSLKTVRNHLASIYVKLGVQSAAQAVAVAFQRGLVSVDV